MQIPRESIERIVHSYRPERRFALAAMQDMQREYTFVPQEGLALLAEYLSCPVSELYSMVTFYRALPLVPSGKHIVKLCNGTACHIRGSMGILGHVMNYLGIGPGETTSDGLFSLELVNCLGACASGPVIMVDEAFYGNMTAEKIPEVLGAYLEKEGQG
jgi:NADH:ubiquinone oxidoreductase subunit E